MIGITLEQKEKYFCHQYVFQSFQKFYISIFTLLILMWGGSTKIVSGKPIPLFRGTPYSTIFRPNLNHCILTLHRSILQLKNAFPFISIIATRIYKCKDGTCSFLLFARFTLPKRNCLKPMSRSLHQIKQAVHFIHKLGRTRNKAENLLQIHPLNKSTQRRTIQGLKIKDTTLQLGLYLDVSSPERQRGQGDSTFHFQTARTFRTTQTLGCHFSTRLTLLFQLIIQCLLNISYQCNRYKRLIISFSYYIYYPVNSSPLKSSTSVLFQAWKLRRYFQRQYPTWSRKIWKSSAPN